MTTRSDARQPMPEGMESTPFDRVAIPVSRGEPLAPHTWLGLGGAATWFCEPVDIDALAHVVRCCHEQSIPLRVIGGGSNVLVPADGFPGMVVRLSAPAFSEITVEAPCLKAGAGAKLVHVVSAAVQAGLAGLEMLVDIPGTVGGAVVGNAGGHGGDIGQRVRDVMVMLPDGTVETRDQNRLAFESRWSNLDDCVVVGCRFELDREESAVLTKRMQKQWILGRGSQPSGSRSVAMMFKDPLGMTAESLIGQAGGRELSCGGATVYGPHANYVVAGPRASSDDVRGLVELVRERVRQRLGIELVPLIRVW